MSWGSSWGTSWAAAWGDAEVVASTPQPTQYKVEYRTEPQVPYWGLDTDPAWGPDSGPAWPAKGAWIPWPGQLNNLTHQGYEFRIKTAGGNIQGKIAGVNVLIDLPDVTEKILNVAIGAAGVRLSLTKTYQVIKVVVPQLLDDGGTAAHIKIVDKDIAGPLIKAYDSNNVLTTAHADITIQGY